MKAKESIEVALAIEQLLKYAQHHPFLISLEHEGIALCTFFVGVFITTLWGESSFVCPEVWLNMSCMHKAMLNEFRLYHIIFRLYQIIFRLYQIILFYFCLYNVYSFLAMSFLHCHHHCLLVLKCHYIHLSSLNVSLFCIFQWYSTVYFHWSTSQGLPLWHGPVKRTPWDIDGT